MNFVSIIESIENELNLVYMPGAIQYVDQQYDCAWSRAIHRFDKALSKAAETQNWKLAELEGEVYRKTILEFIRIYKVHKNTDRGLQYIETLNPK